MLSGWTTRFGGLGRSACVARGIERFEAHFGKARYLVVGAFGRRNVLLPSAHASDTQCGKNAQKFQKLRKINSAKNWHSGGQGCARYQSGT